MGGALVFVLLLGGLHLLVSGGVVPPGIVWHAGCAQGLPCSPPTRRCWAYGPAACLVCAVPHTPPLPAPQLPATAQMGKLHFGIILGWSVVHSMVLWFLVNNVGVRGPCRPLRALQPPHVGCSRAAAK